MCFSATASFAAGAALSAAGGVTVSRSEGKAELPLALVPLLFGIQQITEGFLWVGINRSLAGLQTWTTYIFSMFSHVFWPMFVPFAILLVEPSQRRRRALRVFVAMGVSVGAYLFFFIMRYPVTSRVEGRSIFYDSPHFFIVGVLVTYFLATCASGLFSSHRIVNVFGVSAFGLAVAAYLVSVKTFVSVWCFFAAILSLLLVVHFSGPLRGWRPGLSRERASATMR